MGDNVSCCYCYYPATVALLVVRSQLMMMIIIIIMIMIINPVLCQKYQSMLQVNFFFSLFSESLSTQKSNTVKSPLFSFALQFIQCLSLIRNT